MRISLVEREPQENKQRKRRKKHRRLRKFDSAVARPQALPAPRVKKRRAQSRKAGTKQREHRRSPAPASSTVRPGSWFQTALARLLALVALVGAIGMLAYGSLDARFFVYRAQVVGANHIDAQIVYQKAQVHEQNVFWIRPDQVSARIEEIDGIKAARVRTGLPARVSIEVQEREPVVLWRAASQQRDWWLDEEGRVLPYPGDAASPDMIFVVDSSDRQLEPGGVLRPPELVHSVQQLAAALPGTRIFFYDGDRELSFTQEASQEQWPVYVGTSDDLPRKIQVLQVLDRYLADNGIRPRYVDVRWADHPIYSAPGVEAAGESE